MTKHLNPEYRDMRKQLKVMTDSIDILNLNKTVNELNFDKVSLLNKREKNIIIACIKKYNGIVYGTTIGASIKNPKIAVRKTTDIDVKFKTKKDQKAFAKEVVEKLGKGYYIKMGHYGEKIKRASDHETLVDTGVLSKNYNKKVNGKYQVTFPDEAYLKITSKQPKITNYGKGVKGESYTTSAQRKIHASLSDFQGSASAKTEQLKSDKLRRLGKDLWDTRLYNADALTRAYDMYKKEKDPKKKDQLHKLITEYTYAVVMFSARPDVIERRKEAERMYIKEGMLKKRTFTSPERMKMEQALYKKLKKNPNYDVVKHGVEWLEAKPLKRRSKQRNVSNPFSVNFNKMI